MTSFWADRSCYITQRALISAAECKRKHWRLSYNLACCTFHHAITWFVALISCMNYYSVALNYKKLCQPHLPILLNQTASEQDVSSKRQTQPSTKLPLDQTIMLNNIATLNWISLQIRILKKRTQYKGSSFVSCRKRNFFDSLSCKRGSASKKRSNRKMSTVKENKSPKCIRAILTRAHHPTLQPWRKHSKHFDRCKSHYGLAISIILHRTLTVFFFTFLLKRTKG